jgi:thiamine kinase-like enzyme
LSRRRGLLPDHLPTTILEEAAVADVASAPWSASLSRAAVDAVLDQVECLAALPRAVTPLEGGLTNFNFKVVTPQQTAVVRISSKDSTLLSIDREVEFQNSTSAAAGGAAPAVLDYLPNAGVLVVEFVDGRTFVPSDLAAEATLKKVASICRVLHGGPRFVNTFDMFALQRGYLRIVTDRGFRLPSGYLDFLPEVDRIAAALAPRDCGTVPCNNDLLAGNFIDDGARLWLIDYEYSGNNDACFELGNIWSEANLSLGHLEYLVDSYFDGRLHHKVARARLLGLMSKYGWMLWASIQAGVSTIDFDFWAWGIEKYERAVAEFESPDFGRLLDDAGRAD